jgi:hypothetical protein
MSYLLGIDHNHKTIRGQKFGYLTGIVYMAPHRLAGIGNVCPFASKGCAAACLNTAGRGVYDKAQNARIARTKFFYADRVGFLSQLHSEINALIRKAKRENLTPVVRLNGTSDIPFENHKLDGASLMEHFPNIQFYDYTKNPIRAENWMRGKLPKNYHLTFSRSESNQAHVEKLASLGVNIAVVFAKGYMPESYLNRPVYNGDESDLRFLDPKNHIIGLKAKGKGKRDDSGFVIYPSHATA